MRRRISLFLFLCASVVNCPETSSSPCPPCLRGETVLLPLDVLLQDALVHHDKDACLARLFRRFVMDHAFLHPDDGSLDLDGLPDHFGDGFGSQKTAYDIDLLRN